MLLSTRKSTWQQIEAWADIWPTGIPCGSWNEELFNSNTSAYVYACKQIKPWMHVVELKEQRVTKTWINLTRSAGGFFVFDLRRKNFLILNSLNHILFQWLLEIEGQFTTSWFVWNAVSLSQIHLYHSTKANYAEKNNKMKKLFNSPWGQEKSSWKELWINWRF